MISSLRILGFRAFETLAVNDLGRVNLFVGRNGCGKTTVLEAACLTAKGGDPRALFEIVSTRGEYMPSWARDARQWEFDISHLFHGHSLNLGASFEIEGCCEESIRIACRVIPMNRYPNTGVQMDLLGRDFMGTQMDVESSLGLLLESSPAEKRFVIGLSSSGGIDSRTTHRRDFLDLQDSDRAEFLPTGGLAGSDMIRLWNGVVALPEEDHVNEALRIIEPDVERIAFLNREGYASVFDRSNTAAGIVVKLYSSEKRIPLGCLGDGVRRLLALSLSIIQSANGCVMIDEIDTGLHHSIMSKMWEMVIRTADRLKVQVFAATHSQDCVRGLASLERENPDLCREVRLHRIEPELGKTIVYSAEELLTAGEHKIEVR